MIKIRQATGCEATVSQLFKTPTIAGLAAAIQGAEGAESAGAIPRASFSAQQCLEGMPCSANQVQMAVLHQMQPESAAYNMSSALRLLGRLDVAALKAALAALVRRHEILRTQLVERDGRLLQSVLPADDPRALPALHRHNVLGRQSSQLGGDGLSAVRELVEQESGRPFKLLGEVPLRFSLYELSPEDAVLLSVFHHAISDGASMAIFHEELTAAYNAAVAGVEPDLTPLPIQYADFSAWQAARLAGDELEAQLGYWRQQLAGAPLLLELPMDFPRPAEASSAGATVPVWLDAALTRRLRHLAASAGATMFMVLLAAWQVADTSEQCRALRDLFRTCSYSGSVDYRQSPPVPPLAKRGAHGLQSYTRMFGSRP